jgi:hypothetical protein
MAKRETLNDIADRLEPGVRRAFLESIATVKSDVQLNLLVQAIESGNTERVMALLNLERAYFSALDRGLTAAYQEAGDIVMATWMAQAGAAGAQVTAMFDAANPRAEQWLRTQSSKLITGPKGVIEEIRENVAAELTRGFAEGTSPRTAALNLVGRINRATGKREGGMIGLHRGQITDRKNAMAELGADPTTAEGRALMRNYLNRESRNKTFDRTIQRAMRDGKRIPTDKAGKILTGMENKMLRMRGEMIARTELLGSVHAAQDEGMAQLLDGGKLSTNNVSESWDASNDKFTRDSHAAMDGQVRQRGDPFVTGDGYLMNYPGDRSLGAPAKEIINCRCFKRIDIDWIAQAAEFEEAA